ncbi:MAG: MFS transporter [Rubrivivax sp.]
MQTAPRRVLPALVLAQLAGTSSWFAVNAVMPDLQRQFGWDAAAVGTLTAALQAGFIGGTLVFALLAVADRFSARWVFGVCALGAAFCTVAAASGASSFSALMAWRVLTGVCLAGIYPVGMKIAAAWFPGGLGNALGWLVGALVLGSASPHALRALGADLDWRLVFYGVAFATALAGALLVAALPEAPRPLRPATLHFSALASIWRDRRVRAAASGYFGHMVELYTVWVLVPTVLATRLASQGAVSWGAFAVIGAGAAGCVAGGMLARRFGSARVGAAMLATSGVCCLLSPLALTAPLWLFGAWLGVWGFSVAGDSPQFSALTASQAPPHAVGSVLTLVNSIGFAISVISIECFVRLVHDHALASVLPWIALGPALGLLGLRSLTGSGARPRNDR